MKMKRSVLALALIAMLASACSSTNQNKIELGGGEAKATTAKWKASYMPIEEGNYWIYSYDFGDRQEMRVKHIVTTPRGLRMDDADGECYYFESDTNGWRITGETKLDDDDHAHYFSPAMSYVDNEMLAKGRKDGKHKVTDNGVTGDGEILSDARMIGFESVTLPRLGTKRALHTSFAYVSGPGQRFQIHNWLVDGLGPVKRTLAMTRGETVIFSVTVTLEMARIGGKVLPASDEALFAKTIFDNARLHRQTVDKSFAGLSAKVKVSDTNGKTLSGNVDVSRSGNVEFRANEGADADLVKLTEDTLASRYGHRSRLSGEATPETTKFELLKEARKDSVGVRNLSDTSMGSNYEVVGSRVRVVRRDMGPQTLHLETEDVFWKRKKYLPSTYWWEMRGKDGSKSVRTTAHDVYSQLGAFLLPTTMKLTSEGVTTTIELLEPVLAETPKE